ncbi:hypothetical protein WDU94_012247 [Cyamophila willieti]
MSRIKCYSSEVHRTVWCQDSQNSCITICNRHKTIQGCSEGASCSSLMALFSYISDCQECSTNNCNTLPCVKGKLIFIPKSNSGGVYRHAIILKNITRTKLLWPDVIDEYDMNEVKVVNPTVKPPESTPKTRLIHPDVDHHPHLIPVILDYDTGQGSHGPDQNVSRGHPGTPFHETKKDIFPEHNPDHPYHGPDQNVSSEHYPSHPFHETNRNIFPEHNPDHPYHGPDQIVSSEQHPSHPFHETNQNLLPEHNPDHPYHGPDQIVSSEHHPSHPFHETNQNVLPEHNPDHPYHGPDQIVSSEQQPSHPFHETNQNLLPEHTLITHFTDQIKSYLQNTTQVTHSMNQTRIYSQNSTHSTPFKMEPQNLTT